MDRPSQMPSLQRARQLIADGEREAGTAMYWQCYRSEPTDRDCFIELEKLLYADKKWRAAVDLYDRAWKTIEDGGKTFRRADLLSRKARLLYKQLSSPGEAAAAYLQLVELEPESDEHMKRLAHLCLKEHDYGGLVRAYERRAMLQHDDKRRIATLRQAARLAAVKLRDLREAGRMYELILGIDPADIESHEALIPHYERVHNWEGLLRLLEMRSAVAVSEGAALEMQMKMATVLEEEMQDPVRAIKIHRGILAKHPNHEQAVETLARLLEATGNWMELVEITRQQLLTVRDRTKKGLLYFKCGSIMEAKFGRQDEAIRYYEAAIQSSALCLPAVHSLRDIYARRGDFLKVADTLELEAKLWSSTKERAAVLALLGDVHRDRLGNPEKATVCYQAALAADSECLPANLALFDLCMIRGAHAEARPLLALLMRKSHLQTDYGRRAMLFSRAALLADAEGQRREAAELLSRAIELAPSDRDIWRQLLTIMADDATLHNFASVLAQLEEGFRRRNDLSGQARVLVGKAYLLRGAGHPYRAEQLLKQAIALGEHDWLVVHACADYWARLGRYEEAKLLAEQYLIWTREQTQTVDKARDAEAFAYLSELMARDFDDIERAISAAQLALERRPEHLASQVRVAQLLACKGAYQEAIVAMRRAIALAEKSGVAQSVLADLYAMLARSFDLSGDEKEAERARLSALEHQEGNLLATFLTADHGARRGGLSSVMALLQSGLEVAADAGTAAEIGYRRALARFFVKHNEPSRAREQEEKLSALIYSRTTEEQLQELWLLAEAQLATGADRATTTPILQSVLHTDFRWAPQYDLWERALSGWGDVAGAMRASELKRFFAADWQLPNELPRPKVSVPVELWRAQVDRFEALLVFRLLPLLSEVAAQWWPHLLIPSASNAAGVIVDSLKTSMKNLLGRDVDVMTAQHTLTSVVPVDGGRPKVVLATELLEDQDPTISFHVGRQMLAVQLGCGYLRNLSDHERAELITFFAEVGRAPEEQSSRTRTLITQLGKKTQRQFERVLQLATPVERSQLDVAQVTIAIDDFERASVRVGLWACASAPVALRGLYHDLGEAAKIPEYAQIAPLPLAPGVIVETLNNVGLGA